MPNKQRYCRQLQNNVWIQNFSGWSREIAIPSKSSYFFMVLWHGWSCKEVWNDIVSWQTRRLSNSTKYLLHASMTFTSKEKNCETRERIVRSLLTDCSGMFVLGTYWRLDVLSSVNALAWSIKKWTKACGKRLSRLISYIHLTSEYKQYCYAGVTLQNNADWDCFKTPILKEMLRIQNLRLVEHCAFLEVIHLFR